MWLVNLSQTFSDVCKSAEVKSQISPTLPSKAAFILKQDHLRMEEHQRSGMGRGWGVAIKGWD